MAAVPAAQPSMRVAVGHIAIPALLGVVMSLFYLAGFHSPDPNGLRVEVVGAGPEAQVLAQRVQDALGGNVIVSTVPTVEQATSDLRHIATYGAYVPDPHHPQLLVASAASDTASITVQRIFGPMTAAQGLPLTVTDVAPVNAEHDRSGQSMFFFMVALTVGTYGAGIAVGVVLARRRMRQRVVVGLITATTIASVVTVVSSAVFGIFPVNGWAIWGLSVLYSSAIVLIGIALHTLVGRFTMLTMATTFVALNFTSSGGVFPPSLQSGFFAALNHFWIGSGLNDAGRKLTYFPDTAIVGDVAKLICWFAAGVVLLGAAFLVERRRRGLAQAGAPQPEASVVPAVTVPAGQHHRAADAEPRWTIAADDSAGDLTDDERLEIEEGAPVS